MKPILAVCLCAAAYIGNAEPVTPKQAITAFEDKFGITSGERRNHTKGICFQASFTATEEAGAYTTSPLFNGDTVSVVGRFSHPVGRRESADANTKVPGIALYFAHPDTPHRMAMLNLPFFRPDTRRFC